MWRLDDFQGDVRVWCGLGGGDFGFLLFVYNPRLLFSVLTLLDLEAFVSVC